MIKRYFNSLLIHSFKPGDKIIKSDKDNIKYHYTSPNAFLSILKNKAAYFTDIRYMNDASENIYFVKLLLDFMSEGQAQFSLAQEAINILLDRNDFDNIRQLRVRKIRYSEKINDIKSRLFLFCTCKSCDSLNMWNYYVSNGIYQGYNIGFQVDKLLKTFDTPEHTSDGFMVYYGNVLYKAKDQIEEIKSVVEELEQIGNQHGCILAAEYLKAYIELQGAFYKHSKFESEEEFRIIICIKERNIPHTRDEAQAFFGQYNKNLIEDFHIKNGLIVPHLTVQIPDDAISRITISPTIEFDISKNSIRELLKIKGFRDAKVYSSKIPVRF